MTYLEIVKAVHRKLREDEPTSVASTNYSKMIGELVNDVIREVQDAWEWMNLRQELSITTAAGTSAYAITSSNVRTRIIDIYNTTKDTRMFRVNWKYLQDRYDIGTIQDNSPLYWCPYGYDTSDPRLLQVRVWPQPAAIETLKVYAKVPHMDLETDGTDDTTVIDLPGHPIILGAYAYAIAERGEDAGTPSNSEYIKYQRALGDAITLEQTMTVQETEWQVD